MTTWNLQGMQKHLLICNGRCRDKGIVISYPEGNWYGVPNQNVGRSIVTDTIDDEHKIYTVDQNGLQQVNGQFGHRFSNGTHAYNAREIGAA